MTMFWHDQKVALRIVDDPSGKNFDPSEYPDYQVLETTCAQMSDVEQMRDVMDELSRMLGQEPPERTPEWLEANAKLHASLFGE